MRFPLLGLGLASAVVAASALEWKSIPSPIWSGNVKSDSVLVQWDMALGRWKWATPYVEKWNILPDLGIGNTSFYRQGRRVYFETQPVRYLDLGKDSLQTIYGCWLTYQSEGSCRSGVDIGNDGDFVGSGYCSPPSCYRGGYALDSVTPDNRHVLVWKEMPTPDSSYVTLHRGVIFTSTGFRSTDTGRTWQRYPTPRFYSTPEIRSDTIAMEIQGSQRMALSFDNGATWDTSKVLDPTLYRFLRVACYKPKLVLMVGSAEGWNEFYSADSGRSWLEIEDFKCPTDSESTPAEKPTSIAVRVLVSPASGGFLALEKPANGARRLLRWSNASWANLRDSVDAATAGNYGVRVAIRDTTTGAVSIQTSPDGTAWTTGWTQNSVRTPLQSRGNGEIVMVDPLSVRRTLDGGLTWASFLRPSFRFDDCKVVRWIDSASAACWTPDVGDGTISFRIDDSWRHASYCDTNCSIRGFEPLGKSGAEPTSGILSTSGGFVQTSNFQRFGKPSGASALIPYRDTILALDSDGAWKIFGSSIQPVPRSDFPPSVVAGTWASMGDIPESGLGADDSTLILLDSSGRYWYRTGLASSGVRQNLAAKSNWSLDGRNLRVVLTVATKVRVDLYDLRGRTEAILPETMLPPGTRSFRLPSEIGVRFLRISLDGVPQPTMISTGLERR